MADVESDLFGIWVTSEIAAFDIDHFAKLGVPKTADFEIDRVIRHFEKWVSWKTADFEINHFELYITSKMADFDNDH